MIWSRIWSCFNSLSSKDEIQGYQDEIDTELQTSRPKLRGVYAAYAKEGMEQKGVSVEGLWVLLLQK